MRSAATLNPYTKPVQPAARSKAAAWVAPMASWTKQAVEGKKWSGVQVATMITSMSDGLMPAISIASWAASMAMEAVVSSDLLVSIFSIYSPLHDGAVIIQEDRIVAAKSILPLTDHPDLSPTLGTRHRAAIGLTEETDAICLAVSEETGSISIAVGGDYYGDLDVKELKSTIQDMLQK